MSTDGAPRVGFCCKFVPPDGDRDALKRMNLTSTTIAALGRRERTAALERLVELVRHNMDALARQLEWIAARPPIERMFRIGSGVLPACTHPTTRWVYQEPAMRALIERGLGRAGEIARAAGIRLSMHPGPFCILATKSDSARRNAVDELEYHAEVMGLMGFAGGWHPHGAHVNIHAGSRAAGLDAFRHGLSLLSEAARGLITLENDEDGFGLDEILALGDALPVVLDLHHHWIASAGEHIAPDDPRIGRVAASWRGVRPVAHISAPREEVVTPHPADVLPDFAALLARGIGRRALHAHSDLMWNRPLNLWAAGHLAWADLEVEAKLKNRASAALAAEAARIGRALRAAERSPALGLKNSFA